MGLTQDHPAIEVFRRFGGMSVGKTGPGEECAKSDLNFGLFGLDDFGIGYVEEVEVWNKLLDTVLFTVAEVHHRHATLLMDSSGRCFGASLVHDAFSFVGNTFGEAVERLLLGRRSRPILQPSQEAVMFYGETITDQNPSLFRYLKAN